jgi:hypothetical protein
MSPFRLPPAAVAVAAALSLASPAAASASVERFFDHPKGTLVAPTEFSSIDGCTDTGGIVFPFLDPGGAGSVFVEVGVFDVCRNELLSDRFGFADLDAGDLEISADLTAADLSVTVPASDGIAAGFPATDPIMIDLHWTGTGPLARSLTRYEDGQFEGATVVNHDHETCRDATVAGTVVSGETDYMAAASADTRICVQTAGSLFLFVDHP